MRLFLITGFLGYCLAGNAQEYVKLKDYHTIYTISSAKDVLIETEYSMTILSEKGNDFAIYRDHMNAFRNIRSVEIIIKDQNGKKVRRLSKIDGVQVGFNPNYEINDSKILVINPDYRSYPYTLEVKSVVKLNGFISLPVWNPQPYFHHSVENATLEIITKPEMQLKFREENISKDKNILNDGKNYRYKYAVNNLPSVDDNIRYKEFFERQPKVYVAPKKFELDNVKGSMESWLDFGDWFLGLNSEPYKLTAGTKLYIDTLKIEDKHELIKALYQFMQDKTRYISIQLGIGGFKSLPTEEVEANGYGDCKALTTYMKNLLHYAGISSNYILVRAGKDVPKVIPEFPSNQFNHVFLGVPLDKDTLFLECTSQLNPAGYTGTFTDDRNVLWISRKSSSIIRSRIYDEKSNRLIVNADIEIDEKGNASINLTNRNEGIFFEEIMLFKSAPEDYVKRHNIGKFSYGDFAISNFSYEQIKKNIPEFESKYSLKVNGLAQAVGDRLIMPVNLLNPVEKFIDFDEYFNYGEIPRALTVSESIAVKLEENYWFSKIPDAINIETQYGSYSITHKIDEEKLLITREIKFNKGLYTGDGFKEFKEFIKQVGKAENQKIVLNSKT
jgi:hypothetical protein